MRHQAVRMKVPVKSGRAKNVFFSDKYIEKDLAVHSKINELYLVKNTLHLSGYIYAEDIPLLDSNMVSKLILIRPTDGKREIYCPLHDDRLDEQTLETVGEQYLYAGFSGHIDFEKIEAGEVLRKGKYKLYLQIRIFGNHDVIRTIPLKRNETFLQDMPFYLSRMVNNTATRITNYNLIFDESPFEKSLQVTSIPLNYRFKEGYPQSEPSAIRTKLSQVRSGLANVSFRVGLAVGKLFPIKKKQLVFASDSRDSLSGNLLFVYEELVKRGENLQVVQLLKKRIDQREGMFKLFQKGFTIAVSKAVVLDDFYPKIYTYKLRAGQELIQLWHAVGAFKTFGFSRLGMPGGTQVDSPNHRNYTKAIVSSDEVSEIYAEAFGIPVENIVATGIPRTDVFFDQTHINARKQDLLNEYPYLRDKKVILFAPTFRGNGQLSATYDYRALDLESIYEAFKDTHVFIFKMHPFILDRPQIPRSMRSFFYDLSCHDDINELMFISDILITDYSSACFEYSLLNKPMIFFSYDLKNYLIKRNFYYNYVDFVPGPIALDSDQLIEFIREDKVDQAQLSAFREKYFNHFDGQSSRRVVDEIILPLFPNEH